MAPSSPLTLSNAGVSTSGDAEQVLALHQALGAVPGVHRVTHTMVQMFSRNARLWSGVKPEGVVDAPEGLAARSVSSEFFDVMQLPFVDGDAPSSAEWNANRVAVVSESAARWLWPDRPAIGQRIRGGNTGRSEGALPTDV